MKEQIKLNIDLKNTQPITLDENHVFVEGVVLRKVSKFIPCPIIYTILLNVVVDPYIKPDTNEECMLLENDIRGWYEFNNIDVFVMVWNLLI